MSAGFKYDLVPPVEQEERYDVQTGIRRRGPFKLDTQNLVVGSFLPGFTPICADLKNKFAYAVINVRVAEAYTTGGEALSIKVAKNSLAYVGGKSSVSCPLKPSDSAPLKHSTMPP